MAHPVVHAEIRSQDPDATRRFFADLFGWKIASEGAFPGYTFIDTGAPGGTFVAISPRQSTEDEVLFFVAVEDVEATLAEQNSSVAASFSRPSTFRARVSGCSQTPRATRWVWLPPDSSTGVAPLRGAHSHAEPDQSATSDGLLVEPTLRGVRTHTVRSAPPLVWRSLLAID